MKTLIAFIFTFLLLSSANAQFENFKVGGFVGYGAEFVSLEDYTLTQTQFTFDMQFQTGKFMYGSQSTTIISDSVFKPFTGLKLGVEVWSKGNNKLFVTAHGLLGDQGDKLAGGGVMFQNPKYGIILDLSQRYLRKSFNVMIGAGAYF